MHDISINDNDLYKEYSYLEEFLVYSLLELGIKNAIFSIIFVSDKEIQEINLQYRKKDQVTDVISFAIEENSKIGYNNDMRFLGDIYICIPRMIKQALEYGHSEKRELCFLSIHGLLHLLGYDHETEEEANEMFAIQEKLLDGKNIKR